MLLHKLLSYTLLLAGLLILMHGCAPLQFIPEDLDEEFETTEMSAEEFVAQLPYQQKPLDAIEGRARAQISAPDGSDRASVEFKADRRQSLLIVRNSLGIEGGRMLTDRDSVLVYDRLDSEAFKMSHTQAADYYVQGLTAVNLLEVIQPDFSNAEAYNLFESRTSFVLISPEDIRYFFDREDLTMQQIIFPDQSGHAFSEINFESYADFDGHSLPVRIQILSSDRDTSIFLRLRSITSNPMDLDFDPDIPDDITIRRV